MTKKLWEKFETQYFTNRQTARPSAEFHNFINWRYNKRILKSIFNFIYALFIIT